MFTSATGNDFVQAALCAGPLQRASDACKLKSVVHKCVRAPHRPELHYKVELTARANQINEIDQLLVDGIAWHAGITGKRMEHDADPEGFACNVLAHDRAIIFAESIRDVNAVGAHERAPAIHDSQR